MVSIFHPNSYLRYTSLPLLGPILDNFTTWLQKQGYKIETIQTHLEHSVKIDYFFHQRGIQCLTDLTHSDFEKVWQHCSQQHKRIASTVHRIKQFLEEAQIIKVPAHKEVTQTELELSRFVNFLRNVNGFSPNTIRSYTIYVNSFLKYLNFEENTEALRNLSSKKIENFLYLRAKSLKRTSIQKVGAYLRGFLRFQYSQGFINKPFHLEIDTPRVYQFEKLPCNLSWDLVKKFLNSIDQTNQGGIRDYTMFFLIATYGLRVNEVASLSLDDIDWRLRMIKVNQRKTGNKLTLPLMDAVGGVLLEYLKKARPQLSFRELFFKLNAPSGPLAAKEISRAFCRRVGLSGLDIRFKGPHCLRHSQAVHLLKQGTSLKTIGDLLGHQDPRSTCVYLRLDTEDLRSVALSVPLEQSISLESKIIPLKNRPRLWNQKKVLNSFKNIQTPTIFKSFLAEEIKHYLEIRKATTKNQRDERIAFHSLDSFLVEHNKQGGKLTEKIFNYWAETLSYLSSSVQRKRMLDIRRFCLYRCRSFPNSYVPDSSTFPSPQQAILPYILSELEVGRILRATRLLSPRERCPLRAETFCIAITLLYTTGLRHGELLRLSLDDYNSTDKILLIKDSKFYKSRIIPLSSSTSEAMDTFLKLRRKNHLPMLTTSPVLWNGYGKTYEGKGYERTTLGCTFAALCSSLGIFTKNGSTPRIHDIRHSFAINTLQRWYQAGEDVQAKLPLLATFMGHKSIESTYYYLSFVEGLRAETSLRFQQSYGNLIGSLD